MAGLTVTGVGRYGKWIALETDGLFLVWHLSKAGWVRWSDGLSPAPLKPTGKSTVALRVRLDDGSSQGEPAREKLPGFDLTEAGTKKRLAVHIAADVRSVPQIAGLGPDPLDAAFDREAFGRILAGRNQQIKGVLRNQSLLAGVGNAYSDEILHGAKLSPFAVASKLTVEQVDALYQVMRQILPAAVAATEGKPAKELKDAKRAAMAVHGRTGEDCPVCADVVREVSFADSSLQYCAFPEIDGCLLKQADVAIRRRPVQQPHQYRPRLTTTSPDNDLDLTTTGEIL